MNAANTTCKHITADVKNADGREKIVLGEIFISENAGEPLICELEKTGHTIFRVKSTDAVYEAISAHPDIYMCRIKDTLIVDEASRTEPDLKSARGEEPDLKSARVESLRGCGINKIGQSGHVIYEASQIGREYPYDVAYNAVSTDKFFIHNIKYTSAALLSYARNAKLEIINVKQGYTKCSCVVAADNAIITADASIVRSCRAYNEKLCAESKDDHGRDDHGRDDHGRNDLSRGDSDRQALGRIDILEIEKGHVALEGFDYGFIGGASGDVDSIIYFNGNLLAHPDHKKIIEFITAHGKEVRYFEDYELTDIGSIIYLP